LLKIKLKLALPEILLGINQTIMFALSMLVITALVGTRDLGQEVYIALTKADTGAASSRVWRWRSSPSSQTALLAPAATSTDQAETGAQSG
jgi:hypothetical protein